MVKWIHVIPSGTSVLCNFERIKSSIASALGVIGWCRACSEDPIQDVALRSARPGDRVFDALLNFISEDPEVASAELNALLKFVSLNSHVPPSEVGVLIYSSDTGIGYLCASVIHEYLGREGYHLLQIKPIRIPWLGRSEEVFDDALSNLLDLVVRKIIEWSKKGTPVYINATSGYKAETQFLVLAAAIAGARTAYYIHETFKDVVELPLPLLTLDSRLVRAIKEITARAATSRDEIDEILKEKGLELAELEKDRKLIKNLKPRKWLIKLIKEVINTK